MDNLQATFVGSEQWGKLFQRNNKSSGLKNLRCFPRCSDAHESRAFCGRSITVEFTAKNNTALDLSTLQSWIEIGTVEDDARVSVGSVHSMEDLLGLTRNPEKPSLPMLSGAVLGNRRSEVRAFEFNQRQKGWHYGFVTNKHKSEAEHCVRAYAMVPVGDNQFRCVASFTSPHFRIFCRRRQRHKMNLDLLPDSLRDHILKSAQEKANQPQSATPSSATATKKRKARGKNASSKSNEEIKHEANKSKTCCGLAAFTAPQPASATAAIRIGGRRLSVSPLNSPTAGNGQTEINPRTMNFDGPETWSSATAKNSEDLRLETEAWFAAENVTMRPRYPLYSQYQQQPQQQQQQVHQYQSHQQHMQHSMGDAVLAEVESLLANDDPTPANNNNMNNMNNNNNIINNNNNNINNNNNNQTVNALTTIAPKPFFTQSAHDSYYVDVLPSSGFNDMLSFY